MTLKVFEVLRKGGVPSFPIPKRDAANAALLERLPDVDAAFEFKRRGAALWTPARSKRRLVAGLEQIRMRTGDAIYARVAGRATIYVERAVEYVLDPATPCPDALATGGLVEIWESIAEELQLVALKLGRDLTFIFQGIFNCRVIDGTKIPSQHAFHNAIDGHVASKGRPLDREATTLLVDWVRARGICAEVLWQVSGHYGHFHLTAAPKLGGWPPCMRAA